jgi:hypothetical protein
MGSWAYGPSGVQQLSCLIWEGGPAFRQGATVLSAVNDAARRYAVAFGHH